MKQSLVMTVIGKDRPGLVESLAAIVAEHRGNWEESRMARLGGEFAGLVHVHVPGECAADLERALGGLEGLTVTAARAPEAPPDAGDTRLLDLEVVGQDHPGIIHRVAKAVAAKGINVEELETAVSTAPMSGEKLFQAKARLRAPKSIALDDLERDLEELAHDLMVEVRLAEPE